MDGPGGSVNTSTMAINSLMLSLILDEILGYEREIRGRRDTLRLEEYIQSRVHGNPVIIAGSRAEGFNIKGSDIDKMIPQTDVKILFSRNFQHCSNTDHVVLVRSEGIHPGFTLLEVVRIGTSCLGHLPGTALFNWIENISCQTSQRDFTKLRIAKGNCNRL